jgi:hypothetical protein
MSEKNEKKISNERYPEFAFGSTGGSAHLREVMAALDARGRDIGADQLSAN